MNQYGQVVEKIAHQYEMFSDAVTVSPSALAFSVYTAMSSGTENEVINYLSMEHLKQMCREFLRRTKDTESDDGESYNQGDLDLGIQFSGTLQDRYPLPRKVGEEPKYKLRQHLTPFEREWNAVQLEKSGKARLEHARALRAEKLHQAA